MNLLLGSNSPRRNELLTQLGFGFTKVSITCDEDFSPKMAVGEVAEYLANKKSMAYVGNIVALIKSRLETNENGYHVFNYADKPDFSMTELVSVIESKMNMSKSKLKIPYWIGMLGGYGFDLLSLVSRKQLAVSSVRVKKFCATTQFDASKVHSSFKAPYTLEEGLNASLEHEFINPKEDDILFFSE